MWTFTKIISSEKHNLSQPQPAEFRRGAGGTVVVHLSLTTAVKVQFRHVRRVLSSLPLPNIEGFLRVLRFPSVVTLGQWGVALTGLLGGNNFDDW